MKDLLDRLGSYNVFNYLLPGILFGVFIDWATTVKLLQLNIMVGAFVYYFLGAAVSRVGSLLVEPVLRRLHLVTFEPYEHFVRAVKSDPKLEILSETNNMYRTFCALLLSVSVVAGYEYAARYWALLHRAAPIFIVIGLFALFVVSYRKQTEYIRKRIAANFQERAG